jgi:hypothetical protein
MFGLQRPRVSELRRTDALFWGSRDVFRHHSDSHADHHPDLHPHESGLIVAPVIYRADDADPETLSVTVEVAREQLLAAGIPYQVDEAIGDKGYHKV